MMMSIYTSIKKQIEKEKDRSRSAQKWKDFRRSLPDKETQIKLDSMLEKQHKEATKEGQTIDEKEIKIKLMQAINKKVLSFSPIKE